MSFAWLGQVDPDTLSDVPEPLFGEVDYTPPETLASWLKSARL